MTDDPGKIIRSGSIAWSTKKIKQNYEKERANFESPDVQKKYAEAKNKLEHAWEDFKKPPIQATYRKLSEEQNVLSSELETLRFKAIVMRNESMEKEYLYGKKPGRTYQT